jgi:hypothetical protein
MPNINPQWADWPLYAAVFVVVYLAVGLTAARRQLKRKQTFKDRWKEWDE